MDCMDYELWIMKYLFVYLLIYVFVCLLMSVFV